MGSRIGTMDLRGRGAVRVRSDLHRGRSIRHVRIGRDAPRRDQGEQPSRRERDQTHQQAPEDHESQVRLQDPGGGDGTGRRGDHRVCRVQAEAQRDGAGRQGHAGPAGHGLGQRRQDHESGVAKDRNAHDVADQAHGQGDVLLPDQADRPFGEREGAAGFFEERADDGAGQDHDADGADGARRSPCSPTSRHPPGTSCPRAMPYPNAASSSARNGCSLNRVVVRTMKTIENPRSISSHIDSTCSFPRDRPILQSPVPMTNGFVEPAAVRPRTDEDLWTARPCAT